MALDREAGESQGEREPHLGERERESEQEHGEEKVDSKAMEGRFLGGEGEQAKRVSIEVEGSMSGRVDAKACQEDLQSLGFTPSLAKPEMGKEFKRQRARS